MRDFHAKRTDRQGFTLIELLVYIAIFAIIAGILTAIFYLVINSQKKQSVSGEVTQQLNLVKAIRSAIARVSAATFDSDLLPNQDNTFDIGQISGSNLRWKNGRFSGDLTVGGNVGIGTTSPNSTLDVGGTSNSASIQNLASWGLNARNQGLIIMPEGTVTDNGSGSLTFGSTVIIMNPLSGSWVRVAAGTYALGTWGALWAPIPPTQARGTTVTPTVTAWVDAERNYDGRDRVVLAQRVASGAIMTRFANAATATTGGGGLSSTVKFTTSGTWTKPSGVTKVRVRLVGGGGGGKNNGGTYGSTGGGGGGYCENLVNVTGISSVAVTVGAGGSVDAAGGTSSFGTYCSATGGGPGVSVRSDRTTGGSVSAPGGVGSGGIVNTYGGGGGIGPNGTYGLGGSSGLGTGNFVGVGAYGGGGGAGATAGTSGGSGGNGGVVIVEEYK